MHKNMRRSIAVAATATGMWALGTAAASADELPVSVPLSTPDLAAEAPDTTEAVEALTDTKVLKDAKSIDGIEGVDAVEDTLTEAGGKATGAADVRDALPSDALPSDRLPGEVRTAQTPEVPDLGDVRQAPGAVELPAAPADEIDYLFGPIEQIPGYAQNRAPAAVQGVPAEAGPVVGQTSESVLPPLAAGAVGVAVPVVGQAVGDVGTLARGAVGEVTPFARGVVGDAAAPFVQGVTTEVQPLASGVTGAAVPFAGGVASEAGPLVEGLTGDAVAPFAQGVTTRVQPLAEGVGAQARPFAGGLADTVREDARPVVGHAGTGVQDVTSVTPSFATDAVRAL
ncbi:hypothetical protein [Streptomyces sp. CB02115]|uniref:hypothetical protein n=1 Tax=Streptomyces sp. CB02115 TaxID=1703939 RepID=UPI00093BC562|nr:hypothetical protein [Streptomyces sp. CB02115]OKJ58437.1 hypothetical protein AMK28_04770 [Streptomyces sp. CB02115]